ncbi:hypothetical protein AQJ43_36690 [Streptomyces avermitilis]|uniref:Trypsin-co-occurring domain-containing protein n=2 Tax=Streptomyces avermitilis TaxID=33903 RepID=A0A143SZN2_STRAW|nr:CU044_2847 family protein [Streptomyces avermitilis]KUN48310.1 hypothetical protein AQJ43_36690 [Streptomyces avermitilis]BAU77568.1 hypothetical protein SAVERM_2p124 [Streptomyces avermitilis MA-4680 = NBRC 14893]GDY70235.1 hypothetical protein SAV14893_096280 [Streptomyces avermitilis]GDY80542.1 hypothetical protein SAV31267_100270 [Streptomyces avermitilis]
MGQPILVRAGEQEFFVEVADGGGPRVVAADHALSFDGVRSTIEAVAGQLAAAWDTVKPTEATVEFGLSFSAKTGRLTGLIVDGAAASSLKITLVWKSGDTAP